MSDQQDFRRFAGTADGVLQCCVGYNEFGGYCVPLSSSHRRAARKILAGDVLEPKTIAFMTANCAGGDIVHAGTYFGDFLPALSRACREGGNRVWAFEPNPENHRCAAITLSINALGNVELANAALGSAAGETGMVVADETGRALGGKSQLVLAAGGNVRGGVASVRIVRVDDVVPRDRRVSILQLDVEGHEQAALTGALETIRRCRPILILETLPAEGWLAENLVPLGYAATGTVHANTVMKAEG